MATKDKDLYPPASQVLFAENWKSQSQAGNNGAVFVGTAKVQNGVAVFDGSASYVTHVNKSPFQQATTQPFTMSVDLKTTDTTANVGVWGSGFSGGGAGCFTFILNAAPNYMTAYVGVASGGYALGFGTVVANDGKWHRWVITRSGSNIYSYVDGVYKGTTNIGATTTVYASHINSGTRAAGTAYLTGEIGRCLITKGAWTAQEVLDDFKGATYNYENKCILNLPMHNKIGTTSFTTTDLSGKGNYGTLGASTAAPTKLTDRNGYSFDGGDYILTSSSLGISGDATFSIETWFIKNDTISRALFYGGNMLGSLQGLSVYVNTVAGGQFSLEFAGGNGYRSAVSLLNNNTIYHLVFTKTSGAINTTTKMYLNGLEVAASSASANTPNITNGQIYIGGAAGAGHNGKIFKTKVWDIALTPTQVRDLYFKGSKYLGI